MNAGIGAGSTRGDHRGVADQLSTFLGRGQELRRLIAIVGEQALSDDDRRILAFVEDFEHRYVGQGERATLDRRDPRPRLGPARTVPRHRAAADHTRTDPTTPPAIPAMTGRAETTDLPRRCRSSSPATATRAAISRRSSGCRLRRCSGPGQLADLAAERAHQRLPLTDADAGESLRSFRGRAAGRSAPACARPSIEAVRTVIWVLVTTALSAPLRRLDRPAGVQVLGPHGASPQ